MTGILALFRAIGWRNLLLVLLAIAVFFLVRSQFFPDNPAKPRVVSLFDKVEYVRELRLVTHYSEELLEIGVQDALARKVERQEEKAENALLLARQLDAKSELANNYAFQVAANVANLDRRKRALIEERDRLTTSFRTFDPGRRVTVREVHRIIRQHPNAYSDSLRNKVRLWADYTRKFQMASSSSDRQEYKRQIKIFEESIIPIATEEAARRKEQFETELARIERDLDQIKSALDAARKEEKRAEKEARHSSDEAIEAGLQYQQDTVLLRELETELAIQEVNPLPKLIAVVSTEVTAMVNLEGMETDIDDQNLTICGVPPAVIDTNVRIELSSENRFLTAKNLTIFSSGKSEDEIEKGMYYHVYEEMKEALAEIEPEVIADAVKRGILDEADELALEYLEKMGRSLGFTQVSVLEDCDGPLTVETLPVEISDSILQSSDEIRRKTDSLLFVNDSLANDSLGISEVPISEE